MDVKQGLQKLLWEAAPGIYRRLQAPASQEFSIGIARGHSPFTLQPHPGISNPVMTRHHVTDVPATLVADPFMHHDGRQWSLFFEVVNHVTRKGEIALAVSRDAASWEYRGVVLSEPWHLSYPYVFEWQGEHYMVPESARSGAVTLYRAADFPRRWVRAGTLLEGDRFVDSSLFLFEDNWYMFTDAGATARQPVLRLYCARHQFGPWREHPRSPVLSGNPHLARPAGRVVTFDGAPIRFAQDIFPVYGSRVNAFRITRLTPSEYEEEPALDRAVLAAAGGDAWNGNGMHHVDAHPLPDGSWMGCVDGFRLHEAGVTAEEPELTPRPLS